MVEGLPKIYEDELESSEQEWMPEVGLQSEEERLMKITESPGFLERIGNKGKRFTAGVMLMSALALGACSSEREQEHSGEDGHGVEQVNEEPAEAAAELLRRLGSLKEMRENKDRGAFIKAKSGFMDEFQSFLSRHGERGAELLREAVNNPELQDILTVEEVRSLYTLLNARKKIQGESVQQDESSGKSKIGYREFRSDQ